jgi:hypothetical protein
VLSLLAPAPASSEGLFGTAQVQFQRSEDVLFLRQADGSTRRTPFTREQWIQSYDVNHRAYPRTNVLLQSTFRFTDQAVVGRTDRQTVPTGSMRLLHPYASLFASVQPTFTRQPLLALGASAVDSATGTSIRLQRREAQLIGRVAMPSWPTLDLSWIRRSNDPVDLSTGAGNAFLPGERNRQRSARVAYDRERWSAYGAWTDQRFERDVSGSVASNQRSLRSGGSLRLAPRPEAGLTIVYDYTDTKSGFENARSTKIRGHSADVNGDWRHSERLVTSLTGNFRRTVSTQLRDGAQNDYEAGLLTSWQPRPGTRLSTGGGARTVRLLAGPRTLGYFTTVAAGEGRVRPGWTVNSLASNTVNWDPERGTFAVQTAGGTSRMLFGKRGQLDGDVQVTANGDTASAPQRWTNAWGLRANVQPLRSLTLAASLRSYRVGPGLLEPTARTRTHGADATWRPFTNFDLTGSWVSTGLLPNDAPRLVTRSMTARLSPRPSFQLSGSWSSSTQERASTVATPFVAREFASARMLLTLSRRLATSGGFTVANPGTDRSAKEYDAIVTWSFGR